MGGEVIGSTYYVEHEQSCVRGNLKESQAGNRPAFRKTTDVDIGPATKELMNSLDSQIKCFLEIMIPIDGCWLENAFLRR